MRKPATKTQTVRKPAAKTQTAEKKEKKVQIAGTLRALTRACEPFYQTLIADDVRHDRDSLASKMDGFIRKDRQMRKYRDAIMAHTVVERLIEKTSIHQFIDERQMRMFTTEDDLREYLNNSTFEIGDGTVIRASAVKFADLEREQERKEKHRLAVNEACEQSKAKLELLRPLMVDRGMSRTDAECVIWRQLVES